MKTNPVVIMNDKMNEIIADLTLNGRNAEASSAKRPIEYIGRLGKMPRDFHYYIAFAIGGATPAKANAPGPQAAQWRRLDEMRSMSTPKLRKLSATMKRRYEGARLGFTNYPATLQLEGGAEILIDISVPNGCKSNFLTRMFELLDLVKCDVGALTLCGMGPVYGAKLILIHNTSLSAVLPFGSADRYHFGSSAPTQLNDGRRRHFDNQEGH